MKSCAIAITLLLGAAAPALAASADAPQANVDKRTAAGNSTGNDKVDTLNRGQVDASQEPAATAASAPAAPAPAAAPAGKRPSARRHRVHHGSTRRSYG